MDETTLRALAAELRGELAHIIPDAAERARVDAAIAAALARPEGEGREALLAALSAHEATRQWMREREVEHVRSGPLPGTPCPGIRRLLLRLSGASGRGQAPARRPRPAAPVPQVRVRQGDGPLGGQD